MEQALPRGNALANRVPGNQKRAVLREALGFVVLAQREEVPESGGQEWPDGRYENPGVLDWVGATLAQRESKTARVKKAFGRIRRGCRGDEPILEGSIVPGLATDGVDCGGVAVSKSDE